MDMYRLLCLLLILYPSVSEAQIPRDYTHDARFSQQLSEIIRTSGLDSTFDVGEDGKETISFAVIDLTGEVPVFGGVHYDNFIYPASVYKMYVAMELLKQASEGKLSLYDSYVVKAPNDV